MASYCFKSRPVERGMGVQDALKQRRHLFGPQLDFFNRKKMASRDFRVGQSHHTCVRFEFRTGQSL